jgi:hypothetical protein
VWRLEDVADKKTGEIKQTKVPYSPHNPYLRASTTGHSTWGAFEQALSACEREGYDGVGYVLTQQAGFTGIDLDHCRDPATGEKEPWAMEIVKRLNSYTEVSQSDTGLHILVKGTLPAGGRKKGDIEMYNAGRYFAMTGSHLEGTPLAIEERQSELTELHTEVFTESKQESRRREQNHSTGVGSDDDLLEKIRASKQGAKFKRLYSGDHSDYPSESEADLALCSSLGFWTDWNPGHIDSLFRQSALCRSKWDEKHSSDGRTYGEMTIAKAFENHGDGYRGKGQELTFNTNTKESVIPQDDVLPFPLPVFPVRLQRFISEVATSLPCPIDFVACFVLAVLGLAIGKSRVLAIKDGWEEAPRIWVVVVAMPGDKKSPALEWAKRPLAEFQDQAAITYKAEQDEFEHKEAEYEKDLKVWKSGSREKPEAPAKPVFKQGHTTDITIEAIAPVLLDNPRGVGIIQDELTAWVTGMNQYKGGKGSDRAHTLSLWAGADITINRKGKPPLHVPKPFVPIMGCIPPDVLGELSDERGREDGFIHRLLFCFPEPVPHAYTEAVVSEVAKKDYEYLFSKLRELEPKADDQGRFIPEALHFTDSGKKAFRDWIDDHHSQMNESAFEYRLRGPWAKMEGYFGRLALILQMVACAFGEAASEDVDEVSAAGAAELIDYFKSHAEKVYTSLRATKEDKQLTALLQYLKRHGGKASIRDLSRSQHLDKKDCTDLLTELGKQGFGKLTSVDYPSGQQGDGFELF